MIEKLYLTLCDAYYMLLLKKVVENNNLGGHKS
jgi:hypothetical protein